MAFVFCLESSSRFIVILIIAVLALPSLVNVNQYHDKIQAELQNKLGRSVSLGQMTLKVFPLSLRVNSVQIGEDPRFQTGKPFATANQLDVSVRAAAAAAKRRRGELHRTGESRG